MLKSCLTINIRTAVCILKQGNHVRAKMEATNQKPRPGEICSPGHSADGQMAGGAATANRLGARRPWVNRQKESAASMLWRVTLTVRR